jgi:hypothetical protein
LSRPLSLAQNASTTTVHSERIKKLLRTAIQSSKRHGAWFRLSNQERAICSLAMHLKVKFEGLQLLRALVSILKKLQQYGQTLHARLFRGTQLAWAFSEAAVRWGNSAAKAWRNDLSYIEFLGLIHHRGPAG